jgi:hypothetical protein
LVYAKPAFGGPAAVLAYPHPPRRHRQPPVAMDDRAVRFRWKDYRAADANAGAAPIRTMSLSPAEFLRRPLAARPADRLSTHPALRPAGQGPATNSSRIWPFSAELPDRYRTSIPAGSSRAEDGMDEAGNVCCASSASKSKAIQTLIPCMRAVAPLSRSHPDCEEKSDLRERPTEEQLTELHPHC